MQPDSKTCSHCGETIPHQAKYCSNCGVKFITPTPDIILHSVNQPVKMSAEEAKRLKDEADHFQVG